MRYFGLTYQLRHGEEWREPDIYLSVADSRFGDEETAIADGGHWRGLWICSTH